MQMSPPMDVMVYNHEMEIARMMGSPGTVTMNYIFDSSPYSPGFIWYINNIYFHESHKNVKLSH